MSCCGGVFCDAVVSQFWLADALDGWRVCAGREVMEAVIGVVCQERRARSRRAWMRSRACCSAGVTRGLARTLGE